MIISQAESVPMKLYIGFSPKLSSPALTIDPEKETITVGDGWAASDAAMVVVDALKAYITTKETASSPPPQS